MSAKTSATTQGSATGNATGNDRRTMPWNPVPPLPETWSRVELVWVQPSIDNGRWPIQRSLGEQVEVTAAVLVDGHELLAVELVCEQLDTRAPGSSAPAPRSWVVPMTLRWNDEYTGAFTVDSLGVYTYRVRAWIDRFGTWQEQFRRRVEGGADTDELRSELLDGAALLRKTAARAPSDDGARLLAFADAMAKGDIATGLQDQVRRLARTWDPREGAVESPTLGVRVDPELARFSAWYEFFPRSASPEPGCHATLDQAAELLPRIKDLGFDIVYLPPVHPIGATFRKGKDNAPTAGPDEPGSPWAIGGDCGDGRKGGHKSVHPALGGMPAFERFVARANSLGLHVALDIAFQTSPDHPYVDEHPAWFRHRPDGTIRYAENPPKKYQDVYPLDFECAPWRELWLELRSVFELWIERGVRVFRVDNPHTKPFAFWEWCIGSLRAAHPDLIFLAEAFSRPKIMYGLAKRGYNQSYTYFTWRNDKQELIEYCTELFTTEVGEFFRPNFWPNTPDILHEYLVHGGRPAHVVRLVLAATLSSSYGVYGPPYEHVYNNQHPAREEYADNEKYEIRVWRWNDPGSLQPLMKRINRIRRGNPALQHMRNLRFHHIDNPALLVYSKTHGQNTILVAVNLDPHHTQAGWLDMSPEALGLPAHDAFEVHDLLGGERYTWQGARHFIQLDPQVLPAHVFRVGG